MALGQMPHGVTFEASREEPHDNPSADVQRAWLQAEGPGRSETFRRRIVTFTFDDGPGPKSTRFVLNVLAKHHVRGAFFMIGSYLDGTRRRDDHVRDIARDVAREGHIIGNHSYSHQRLVDLPVIHALDELEWTRDRIERITGVTPRYIRPPYGALDEVSQEVVAKSGTPMVLWSIEANDMMREDDARITKEIIGQIQYAGGGIVLLHDIKWGTAKILDDVLTWLEEHPFSPETPEREGYAVVDLPTYLRETAERPQPFQNRDDLLDAREAEWKARERTEPREHKQAPAPGPSLFKRVRYRGD